MQNKLLVIMRNSEEKTLQSYYTENFSETLKFFLEAKEKKIPIALDDGKECTIDTIFIQFASDESLLCLELYTEVVF